MFPHAHRISSYVHSSIIILFLRCFLMHPSFAFAASGCKAPIWSPAPISVRPFCPEFWSTVDSPSKPSASPWASLDSPGPTSSKATGMWTILPGLPARTPGSDLEQSLSPQPLPLSPISSPSSSPPTISSIYASVPNNAPNSRSLQAARVPVVEQSFSFNLGVPTAKPLPAASDKHFTRSLSLGAALPRSSFADRISSALSSSQPALTQGQKMRPASTARNHSATAAESSSQLHNGQTLSALQHSPSVPSSFTPVSVSSSRGPGSPRALPPLRKAQSPGTSPAGSPRKAATSMECDSPRKHHWCWRCGQRADLATQCLVCMEDFAVCRGCAHERAAKGKRPDTCLCAGCMSRPIDPLVIERIQNLMSSSGARTSVGSAAEGSCQKGVGSLHKNVGHNVQQTSR